MLYANRLKIGMGPNSVEMRLSDFNRLRWTVQALLWQPQLLNHAKSQTLDRIQVTDTSYLLSRPHAPLPKGCVVVMWDGLNSSAEFAAARPDLATRTDLSYLYVGHLAEIATGFPPNSVPLFPCRIPALSKAEIRVRLPAWFKVAAAVRRRIRPIKNARLSPLAHRRLTQGGCLVFCGVVRPSAAVLDGFLLGVSHPDLREKLQPLVDLEWQVPPSRIAKALHESYDHLRGHQLRSTEDFSAFYSILSLMYRMGTLSNVSDMSSALLINEYGIDPHLDPYDADAYGRNLFIDFGSSRGPGIVYPRTVDIWQTRKQIISLRFLHPEQSLSDYLAANDARAFLAQCLAHSEIALSELSRLPAVSQRF